MDDFQKKTWKIAYQKTLKEIYEENANMEIVQFTIRAQIVEEFSSIDEKTFYYFGSRQCMCTTM